MLTSQFVAACETPSDINEHLRTFVEIAERLQATKVIELGTRGGVSTIAWLFAMTHTDGHLWSVDVSPPPPLEHDRWTFVQGDDTHPDTLRQLPLQADIVFIDTSHLYVHTLQELNIYRHRVRPGGRIVLHDTELARPETATRREPLFPVKRAVEEFCTDEGFVWTNHPNNNGLGIIQIPG